MRQLTFWGMTARNTEVLIDRHTDELYAEAREFYKDGYAVLKSDAIDVPEEFLGEVVKIADFAYPESCAEPLMYIEGYDEPIAMSSFRPVSVCY